MYLDAHTHIHAHTYIHTFCCACCSGPNASPPPPKNNLPTHTHAGVDGLPAGSEAQGYALGRLVQVIVHEIIHVLGFGSTHYEDWRGPDGKLYGRTNVIVNKEGRPYLATPKVGGKGGLTGKETGGGAVGSSGREGVWGKELT